MIAISSAQIASDDYCRIARDAEIIRTIHTIPRSLTVLPVTSEVRCSGFSHSTWYKKPRSFWIFGSEAIADEMFISLVVHGTAMMTINRAHHALT